MNTSSQSSAATAPVLQLIYLKDLSCESPPGLEMLQRTLKSHLGIEFNVKSESVSEHLHEVELHVSIKLTSKPSSSSSESKILAQLEMIQAGIFSLAGFTTEQSTYHLNTTCPAMLFPSVSTLVSNLAERAFAMPLYLPPVNFEALFLKHTGVTQIEDKV